MTDFPCNALVDHDAIRFNLNSVRERVGPSVSIAACVKANAYGHGFGPVIKNLTSENIDMLCVSCAAEALEAKCVSPNTPVLIFGGFLDKDIAACLNGGIQQTVSSIEELRRIEKAADSVDAEANVHVNVDTGMGRIGVALDDAEDLAEQIRHSPRCKLKGIYTHFPSADETDLSFSENQLKQFEALLDKLKSRGIQPEFIHTANSGAIHHLKQSYFNMVRLGVSLYGYYPSWGTDRSVPLKPALTLKTHIMAIRDVNCGSTISYGRTFMADHDMKTAVLPIGYGDGYQRGLSNAGEVLINGRRAPVVGTVCMDITIVDITGRDDIRIGDEVIVYSNNRDDPNSVESVAAMLGTIPYDITCALTSRVSRIHLNNSAP